MQLEIEEAALKKETDKLSHGRLEDIQEELARLRDEYAQMKSKWENEKQDIGKVQRLREEIEHIGAEIVKAEREYDLNRAADTSAHTQVKAGLAQLEQDEAQSQSYYLRDRVTGRNRALWDWTGIPVSKLMEGDREKLLRLPELLHQRGGTAEAVQLVSDAIWLPCGHIGCQPAYRSFLFLGPPAWVKPNWPWPKRCLTTTFADTH